MSYKYVPNPKHGEGVGMGVKGSRLDLATHEAEALLNDPGNCFTMPGGRHRMGIKDRKIYIFHNNNAGGYSAYPLSGREVCTKHPEAQQLVADKLGISVKKLSQMGDD